jgi:PhnB protein
MPPHALPIPAGYHSLTPYLYVHDGVAALQFYARAFGARELYRMEGPSGKIGHAELQVGDSRLMLADEAPEIGVRSPKSIGGSAMCLLLYVEDVDRVMDEAVRAGGTVTRPVKDQFYGDRTGVLTDPFGHLWTVATHKEDVSPEELQRRASAAH